MFKEAFITVLCFIILYVILRILFRKNELLAKRLILGGLVLTMLFNAGHNAHAFFPALVLDETAYLGDAEENLFIYNEKSEFRDQILFPVLRNRTVLVDESAWFYALFFQTFAGSTEELSLTERELSLLVASRDELSFSAPLKIANLMNYAFPVYVEISSVPDLYLDEERLTGENMLIAVSDELGNLYLFTESTYREVTGQ